MHLPIQLKKGVNIETSFKLVQKLENLTFDPKQGKIPIYNPNPLCTPQNSRRKRSQRSSERGESIYKDILKIYRGFIGIFRDLEHGSRTPKRQRARKGRTSDPEPILELKRLWVGFKDRENSTLTLLWGRLYVSFFADDSTTV